MSILLLYNSQENFLNIVVTEILGTIPFLKDSNILLETSSYEASPKLKPNILNFDIVVAETAENPADNAVNVRTLGAYKILRSFHSSLSISN